MKDKALIVTDVDNTITDFFNTWGKITDKALDSLAESRGMKREDLVADIRENVPGEDRFHNIAGLIKHTPSLQPKTEAERAKFEKDDARIIKEWQKGRSEGSKPYEGVIQTFQRAKASGAKVVLFTDSPERSTIERVSMLGIDPKLIDKIYTQPNVDKDGNRVPPPLEYKGPHAEVRNALAAKTVVLPPDTHKPNPKALQQIMDDMGVKPEHTVMVGDNIRSDGGSGIGAGTDYAWQKAGTVMKSETDRCMSEMNDKPDYKIGTAAHLAQMNDDNRPTVVLEGGFKELNKHFRWVSADKVAAQSASKAVEVAAKPVANQPKAQPREADASPVQVAALRQRQR